jgi:hypothetical protein
VSFYLKSFTNTTSCFTFSHFQFNALWLSYVHLLGYFVGINVVFYLRPFNLRSLFQEHNLDIQRGFDVFQNLFNINSMIVFMIRAKILMGINNEMGLWYTDLTCTCKREAADSVPYTKLHGGACHKARSTISPLKNFPFYFKICLINACSVRRILSNCSLFCFYH